ncbi:DUF1361 domain-containing protein [Saccharibacillus kuerlensis]|uniref:DUF1361 domain-containing protein n=1 Tax=Saccharibacillus kuerlensis TaxID=459527 RepID=A0ABQ2KRL7_9BACL|nr:DUF1361 domain-containing protein [Saccharibacillus kuerlensis]GGN90990.1 hypothetical protein GCM10010969_02010 [Saccharibacillus kuerlensis]
MNKLRSLQYPWKLYIWLTLLLLTLLDLAVLLDIRSGAGVRQYRFMLWNYFLAWIPAAAAIGLDVVFIGRQGAIRRILLAGIGLLWLFFYPNASYLLTDLLHVFRNYAFDPRQRFWGDIGFWHHLLPMLLAALIGLLIASAALYSVHRLVSRAYGQVVGTAFAVIVLLLSSFGVYMGRFIRWNSWDVVSDPLMLIQDMAALMSDPAWMRHLILFGGGMFVLQGGIYAVLYLFTKLNSGENHHER